MLVNLAVKELKWRGRKALEKYKSLLDYQMADVTVDVSDSNVRVNIDIMPMSNVC